MLRMILLTGILVATGCGDSEESANAGTTGGTEAAAASAPDRPAPNPHRDAYFGETHMHTAYSLDAYIGGTRLTPSDAYRFARGKTVTVDGQPHTRKRPLDFVAVSDHAEYIGEMYSTIVEGAPGHDQELLCNRRDNGNVRRIFSRKRQIVNAPGAFVDEPLAGLVEKRDVILYEEAGMWFEVIDSIVVGPVPDREAHGQAVVVAIDCGDRNP